MSDIISSLTAHGRHLLLEHTRCLIVLLDRDGTILEQNHSFKNLHMQLPRRRTSIYHVLEHNSLGRFHELLDKTINGGTGERVTLHFSAGESGLPTSYECRMVALPEDRLLFFADPIPALNEKAVHEYVHVTNELALKNRELQRAKYELTRKHRALEEALRQIERLAYIDELTQLLNRRKIISRLEEEIARVNRYGGNLSVFILDVDHFKYVNDTYGHQAGDIVLQHVAQTKLQSLRRVDLIGRYGGEEFLVVLPSTALGDAVKAAMHLCEAIATADFVVEEDTHIHLTVSIGVAHYNPTIDTLETLLSKADKALYRAKNNGRNQVCTWDN